MNLRISYLRICVFCLFATVFMETVAFAESTLERESRLKAALLYYLTKFVQWPASSFKDNNDPLTICLVGDDNVRIYLESTVKGKKANDRRMKIAYIGSVLQFKGLSQCHLVALGQVPDKDLAVFLKKIEKQAILTVGIEQDITVKGGIIYLFKKQNKFHVKIQLSRAKERDLRISSELLDIAEVVRDN